MSSLNECGCLHTLLPIKLSTPTFNLKTDEVINFQIRGFKPVLVLISAFTDVHFHISCFVMKKRSSAAAVCFPRCGSDVAWSTTRWKGCSLYRSDLTTTTAQFYSSLYRSPFLILRWKLMASTATVTTLVRQWRAATMPATSSISFMVTPVGHTRERAFRIVQSQQHPASIETQISVACTWLDLCTVMFQTPWGFFWMWSTGVGAFGTSSSIFVENMNIE